MVKNMTDQNFKYAPLDNDELQKLWKKHKQIIEKKEKEAEI